MRRKLEEYIYSRKHAPILFSPQIVSRTSPVKALAGHHSPGHFGPTPRCLESGLVGGGWVCKYQSFASCEHQAPDFQPNRRIQSLRRAGLAERAHIPHFLHHQRWRRNSVSVLGLHITKCQRCSIPKSIITLISVWRLRHFGRAGGRVHEAMLWRWHIVVSPDRLVCFIRLQTMTNRIVALFSQTSMHKRRIFRLSALNQSRTTQKELLPIRVRDIASMGVSIEVGRAPFEFEISLGMQEG